MSDPPALRKSRSIFKLRYHIKVCRSLGSPTERHWRTLRYHIKVCCSLTWWHWRNVDRNPCIISRVLHQLMRTSSDVRYNKSWLITVKHLENTQIPLLYHNRRCEELVWEPCSYYQHHSTCHKASSSVWAEIQWANHRQFLGWHEELSKLRR